MLSSHRPRAKGSLSAAQIRAWRLVCIGDLHLLRTMADGDPEQITRALHASVATHGCFHRLFKHVQEEELKNEMLLLKEQVAQLIEEQRRR